jgi:hypothetical protein
VDGCEKPTTSNKYIRARDGLVKSFSTAVKEEDMKNHTPTEWLINHHKSEIKATNQHNQAFVLSASMAEMNEAGELCIDTITSSFVLQVNQLKTKGGSDGVSYTVLNPMRALVEVGVFFSFLHVITKEYPFCAFALVEMRMTAVAKLMRNAESKGNSGEAVEYFFTAIKLALPLFAVAHKTDYVYLTQEL